MSAQLNDEGKAWEEKLSTSSYGYRTTLCVPDGSVIYDAPKGADNTFENAVNKAIDENHNTVLLKIMYQNDVVINLKILVPFDYLLLLTIMEDQMNVRNIMIVKRNIDVMMEHVFIKKIIKIKGDYYWENKLA
eukprot:273352_1